MIDPTRLKRRKGFVDPRQQARQQESYGQDLALWQARGLRLWKDFSAEERETLQRKLEGWVAGRRRWTPWTEEGV